MVSAHGRLHQSVGGSAFANFAEANRGTLTRGKYADLVVLSRDLFAAEGPHDILDTTVTHTVVGGRVVHRAGD
jgi:predicted amidohydrolase YtcJ